MKHSKCLISALTAAVVLLSSCGKTEAKPISAVIDASELNVANKTGTTAAAPIELKLSGVVPLIDEDDEEEVVVEKPAPRIPIDTSYDLFSTENTEYPFSEEYIDFLSRCTFVGDSICNGLRTYGILPSTHVCALGNVGTRNIHDDWVTFTVNNTEMSVIPAIETLNPEYVVLSMGMNDINLISKDTYIDNYAALIDEVKTALPDATIIVLSITPVAYREDGKIFTYNEDIDAFNAALKEYCITSNDATFIDVTEHLKTANNTLKLEYLGSADGVHLTEPAYYPILHAVCERAVDGIEYSNGYTCVLDPIVK